MSWRRKLEVVFTGDTKQLQRTFKQAESQTKAFGKTARAGLLGSGLSARGGVAAIGGAVFATGLKRSIDAAREAEVVLGQTGVAVQAAGLQWGAASKRIEDGADAISKAASLDDEEVLKSFQVFIRGQKDVGKALELSSLAANVARGRYISLDQATQLVNKASMGQVGALRRVGIQIDKNATATEAITLLQKNYANAAKEYSDSAAGSADRLRVAWENLAEQAGGPLSSALAKVTDGLTSIIISMDGVKASSQDLLDPEFRKKIVDTFGIEGGQILQRVDAMRPSGPGGPGGLVPNAGRPVRKPGSGPPVITGLPPNMRDNLLNAQIQGNRAGELRILKNQADYLRKALKDPRLGPKRAEQLKEELLGVVEGVRSIQDQMAAEAEAAAADARSAAEQARRDKEEARRKHQQALKDAREAAKRFAEKMRDQAESLKDAALAQLDRAQEGRNVNRDIADATAKLALAKRLGSKAGVREASRMLEDAQFDRQRLLLEEATFNSPRRGMVGGSRAAGTNGTVFHIGNMTVVADSPEDLLRALQRQANTSSTPRRGRYGGANLGIG